MIYANTALVQWFSKKQSTVVASVFGAEFFANKQGIDSLRGLRNKLRIIVIPISCLSHIFGDNMSVIQNTLRPESVLRKKNNSGCYHTVCESVAMEESLIGHIPSKENITDLMTKILYGHNRRYVVSNILYDIHDDH